MIHSNFTFLRDGYSILFNLGQAAEANIYRDPANTLFKLRLFGEKLTELLFELNFIEFPYQNTFHNCLKTLQHEGYLPDRVKDLLFTIKNKGNLAVHENIGDEQDAKTVLFSAFKVAKWFYTTYSEEGNYISDVKFSLPENIDTQQLYNQLEEEYKTLEQKFNTLLAEREIKAQSTEEKQIIVQKSKKAASKIEMSEAETRLMIDEQLRAAGWEANTVELNYKTNKTLPQKGRNMAIAEWSTKGKWADYALFIGLDLYGIVEAKKYAQDISTDLTQSKIYAELAEAKNDANFLGAWNNYRVPFLFSTNGRPFLEQIKTKSGIWFLDARKERNRSRPIRGWFSPQGLKEIFERDIEESNKNLNRKDIDFLRSKTGLSLRDYQIEAIKAVENQLLEKPEVNRFLLAMATGTGKTRTVLGLCYRLIQSNRFKRILFMVDRRLLANQSFDTFKDNKIEDLQTFASVYQMEGLKETFPDNETRLHFATVQGMVQRLFYTENESDKLPIDAYDCIVVDEAHRGYLQDREMDDEELNFKDQQDYVSKYRQVLDYFDAYAVGLTATPALHTKEIFGEPLYTYSYREAVIDGFLADHDPPYIIKTKLSEEGIHWEKGEKPKYLDRETNSIKELSELEDDISIDVAGFNKLVITESFNRTVAQQLVKEIDPEGEEKTLIFASTDEHADRVVEILKEEFEAIGIDVPDEAIVKVTGKSYNPHDLVKRYKNEKYPNIAVTVDLLTTGIDVPAICNLVFLRRIRSRILYEQMLGRATRKCDEINKDTFRIFDAVRIYEALEDYSTMKPVVPNPSTTFEQLVNELPQIETNERSKRQLEQIIAKLQRKKRLVVDDNADRFEYYTQGTNIDDFIEQLRNSKVENLSNQLNQYGSLWKFLDELKPAPSLQLVSFHEDEYRGTERGYGKGQKPEDYLESFKEYIAANQNKIAALQIVCTKPKELDRKSLKELKLQLDAAGFTTKALNAAWKDAKNETIAADIISYIRTLALGNTLISHDERIKNAVSKVRDFKNWNRVQSKWIDRFEMQLLKENIITKEDLDADPFDNEGGFKRLNRIFDDKLEAVIEQLNEELYTQQA